MSRDETFDIMKCIGILSVIAGHCIIPDMLHRFIYMWHMPLFFFVSGYFYRPKSEKEVAKNSIRGLIIPYFVTFAVILTVTIIYDILYDKSLTLNRIQGLLTIRYYFDSTEMKYGGAGALWFLPALFWCRVLYNTCNRSISNNPIKWGGWITVSYLAIYIGFNCFVPLFLCHGLQGIIFYHIGYESRKVNYLKKQQATSFLFAVLVCGIGLGMSQGTVYCFALYYSCWILNIIAAYCCILMIYHVSCKVTHWKYSTIMSWVGRYSILVLCIHATDGILGVTSSITKTDNTIGRLLYNISFFLIALSLTYLASKSKRIRRIYNIK